VPPHADLFFGTFLPFARALESPIAIACFWVLTVLPLPPLFNVPALRRSMARLTSCDADFAYLDMALFPSFRSLLSAPPKTRAQIRKFRAVLVGYPRD
jgi:hypothetical protein